MEYRRGTIRPLPKPAQSRYAPYIEELQEFFATSGLEFGTPECIFAIDERLRTSAPSLEAFSSLVRSIILRRGGSMPPAELFQILSFAVGGADMEQASQVYFQPMRELVSFVTGVLSRPSNQPPGKPAEVVSFPSVVATPTATPAFTAEATALDEPAPAPREQDAPANPGSQVLGPPPPPLEIHLVPPNPSPELPPAKPAAKELQESRPAEPPPLVPEQPIQQPVAAAESMPPAADTLDPPVLRSPAETKPVAPVWRDFVTISLVAAVLGLLLVVALQHYSPISHDPQPTVAETPPAAGPDRPQAATTPTVDPVDPVPPAKPAAGRQSLNPAPTPTRRRSSTGNGYVALPAYSTGLTPSDPARPAAAPGATQVGAPAPATANPVLASTPARVSGKDTGELSAPGRDSTPALADLPPYLDVSSGVMAGNLISAPLPHYPTIARMAEVEGEVVLQADISSDGSVSAVRVISGPRLLRAAAVAAVRRWRYRPCLVEGRPVDVSTTVTLNFHSEP